MTPISVHVANSTLLSATSVAPTPITPSYTFGHDEHNEKYHLHDHSHSHGHGHEGHSHNMRGVFLHVMAVSIHLNSFLYLDLYFSDLQNRIHSGL